MPFFELISLKRMIRRIIYRTYAMNGPRLLRMAK